MRSIGLAALIGFITLACKDTTVSQAQTSRGIDVRINAAAAFTDRYARSRMTAWKLRAHAAGEDCTVLFIETPIILEDSMVEAMHYGAGAYDVTAGGVQQFSRDRTFRSVTYKDGSGRIWTYGGITPGEAGALKACA
jgi:hypothetical protein